MDIKRLSAFALPAFLVACANQPPAGAPLQKHTVGTQAVVGERSFVIYPPTAAPAQPPDGSRDAGPPRSGDVISQPAGVPDEQPIKTPAQRAPSANEAFDPGAPANMQAPIAMPPGIPAKPKKD
ncbi:MAG: hypothetical protein AB1790_09440 [Pseudomonadota bacterium]